MAKISAVLKQSEVIRIQKHTNTRSHTHIHAQMSFVESELSTSHNNRNQCGVIVFSSFFSIQHNNQNQI